MGRNKDIYVEPKSGEVKSLKKRLAKLENENRRLKSELKTFEAMFRRTVIYLKKDTEELSIEQIIKGVDDDKTLFQIKEDNKGKWSCHHCEEGELNLIIVPGNRYFRRCNKCPHRTQPKEYTSDVEK